MKRMLKLRCGCGALVKQREPDAPRVVAHPAGRYGIRRGIRARPDGLCHGFDLVNPREEARAQREGQPGVLVDATEIDWFGEGA